MRNEVNKGGQLDHCDGSVDAVFHFWKEKIIGIKCFHFIILTPFRLRTNIKKMFDRW